MEVSFFVILYFRMKIFAPAYIRGVCKWKRSSVQLFCKFAKYVWKMEIQILF